MPQVQRLAAALALLALLAVLGAVIATGGREHSTCPRGIGVQVAQPKAGPGRPPTCPVTGR